MKKILLFIIAAFLMPDAFSQYFNTSQVGMLMGSRTNLYSYGNTETRTEFFPSFFMTNGIIFNEYMAAGIGVGIEYLDRNLIPAFFDIRRSLRDNDVSPFFGLKMGYSFSTFKKERNGNHYFKKNGGFMLHPEMGVKIPLSERADLQFSVAYRFQELKTTNAHEIGNHTDKDVNKTNLNRLYFGMAIMFR